MKKLKILLAVFFIASLFAVLNMRVSTRQGVDYQVYTRRLPLYLKLLDFFDRHYNYRQTVEKVIRGAKTDEERVMRIFEWTYWNIRRVPEGFPVVDDHVWHIIIRGYGTADQYSDVFTTLCNYAGVKAFFSSVYSQDRTRKRVFSFVMLNNKWHILDPYAGVYFKDHSGALADVDTVKKPGAWLAAAEAGAPADTDYSVFFEGLPQIDDPGFTRPSLQSPLRRGLFEIGRRR